MVLRTVCECCGMWVSARGLNYTPNFLSLVQPIASYGKLTHGAKCAQFCNPRGTTHRQVAQAVLCMSKEALKVGVWTPKIE